MGLEKLHCNIGQHTVHIAGELWTVYNYYQLHWYYLVYTFRYSQVKSLLTTFISSIEKILVQLYWPEIEKWQRGHLRNFTSPKEPIRHVGRYNTLVLVKGEHAMIAHFKAVSQVMINKADSSAATDTAQ